MMLSTQPRAAPPARASLRVERQAQCKPVSVRTAAKARAVSSRSVVRVYAADAQAATTDTKAEGPSFVDKLKKSIKRFVTNLAIDMANDEAAIRRLAERFPPKIRNTFEGLFDSYITQMTLGVGGDRAEASRRTVDIFKRMIKAYAGQLDEPYEFPSYHTAMRDPFDYYQLGNDYVGAMIDWKRSVLRNERRWDTVLQQLAAGENVILLANHQSEADAAFIPLMTASSHPAIGEKVIYVAGDRVTSDLMAKPFSMGRNLLNVHSKKYMDAEPALKSAKMRQNLRTLKEMERLLKEGGKLLWIAPSGGRDRRKDGVLSPDRFDPDAVEMMRKMGTKKGMNTHYYPLAMATYDMMPPPEKVESNLGEKRLVNYTGCGLSLGEEIDVSETGPWAEGVDVKDNAARTKALAEYVFSKVCAEYDVVSPCMGGKGDFPLPEGCTRPWLSAGAGAGAAR